MRIEQLEHLIRAAGDIIGDDRIIVIGSQAILASYPDGLPPPAIASDAGARRRDRPRRS
jgi:hypothetical protein